MASWRDWAARVLHALGAPASEGNLNFLEAWAQSESGRGGGKNNPLNDTRKAPGSTNYNSFTADGHTYHVQNYTSVTQGALMTALSLKLSYYKQLLADLRAGHFSASQLAARNQHALSVWGTNASTVYQVAKEKEKARPRKRQKAKPPAKGRPRAPQTTAEPNPGVKNQQPAETPQGAKGGVVRGGRSTL